MTSRLWNNSTCHVYWLIIWYIERLNSTIMTWRKLLLKSLMSCSPRLYYTTICILALIYATLIRCHISSIAKLIIYMLWYWIFCWVWQTTYHWSLISYIHLLRVLWNMQTIFYHWASIALLRRILLFHFCLLMLIISFVSKVVEFSLTACT